jgi:hypothetical protein
MPKGKIENWNPDMEQDSFYFKKEKKPLTPQQIEGNFSALMAGNVALLTGFFCCCAVGPALNSISNAMLMVAGASLGVIGAYSLRKNALNLLKKGGLLEVYSEMLKNLHHEIKKLAENKDKNIAIKKEPKREKQIER